MTIYGLADPVTMEVRYIGLSKDPDKRLAEHVTDAVCGDAKRQWVKGIVDSGAMPVLVRLDTCTLSEATERESVWIKRFGPVLFNQSCNPFKLPPVARRSGLMAMRTLAEVEKDYILAIVRQVGNRLAAAKILGIGRQTLYNKLREYGEPLQGSPSQPE